jgi:competence ComEA-like helix-hairpin-helix protein
MAPSERRALLLLLSLAVVGHAVRRIATRPDEAPGGVELLATAALVPGSPAAHRDSVIRLARPLAPGERIDVDRASAQEIARLPRIGLALARTIVADREANGPFGGLAGLDRVSGVGANVLRVVEPHVTFSGTPSSSWGSQDNRTFAEVVSATPNSLPTAGTGTLVSLNTASASELEALPSVGPSRAQAIVRHRETHGPFLSVEALAQVPGIGPAALARLRPLVTVH